MTERDKNLYQEAVLVDYYRKDKVLGSVQGSVNSYIKYINQCIGLIEKQSEIHFEVNRREDTEANVYYEVQLDALSDKKAKQLEKELFENGIKTIGYKNEKGKVRTVAIDNRNQENRTLELKESLSPAITNFYLKANTYQLRRQKDALIELINLPIPHQEPLLRLFDYSPRAAEYFSDSIDNTIQEQDITWRVLTDEERNGNSDQRSFVTKALRTKDFALLEGPPGSGKTTAIIELILQLIAQNKRVLLVSATHVAVDNVIDRILTTYKENCEGKVMPIRIGNEGNIRKESVKPYRLQTFVARTKRAIKNKLAKQVNRTPSQQRLLDSFKDNSRDDGQLDEVILNSANLVGGTMIGVLQHPTIKSKESTLEPFDVMIVDESSKVTFLDFIVPALYAKKWMLVGDVQQLSPYVEDDYLQEAIDATWTDERPKQAIMRRFDWLKDLTINKKEKADHISVWIAFGASEILLPKEVLEKQHIVFLSKEFEPTTANVLELNAADGIICSIDAVDLLAKYVFVKIKLFGTTDIEHASFVNKQRHWHTRKLKRYNPITKQQQPKEWKEAVGSRLAQYYQYRMNLDFAQSTKTELDLLLPEDRTVVHEIEQLRKMALPSMLELLQKGIGKTISQNGYQQEQIIYDGFNQFGEVKTKKFETLSYQHRMQESLAAVSKEHFYAGTRLHTANRVQDRLNPMANYEVNHGDIFWVTNDDKIYKRRDKNGRNKNINPQEVKDILRELKYLLDYTKQHPKKGNELFEIALLTFYRQQEFELKKMLRNWTGQNRKHKFFSKGKLKITLCTVDKFQGDEADVVLLSFVKPTPRAFYHNPNRLNVALTRARYQLILFGNRTWMEKRSSSPALNQLARDNNERIINRQKKSKS